MLSEKTREFIDDIDDQVVKAELLHLVATVEGIKAGATGANAGQEAFVKAFDKSVEGWRAAVNNQYASINRLLERVQAQQKVINDQTDELLKWSELSQDRLKVGPE